MWAHRVHTGLTRARDGTLTAVGMISAFGPLAAVVALIGMLLWTAALHASP